jgi:hypothetical protein
MQKSFFFSPFFKKRKEKRKKKEKKWVYDAKLKTISIAIFCK